MPVSTVNQVLGVPEQLSFATKDELLKYLFSFSYDFGFSVSLRRSKEKRLWIVCRRGRTYENKKDGEASVYNSGTVKIDCPFELLAKLVNDAWVLEVVNAEHNHDRDIEDATCGQQRLTATEMDKFQQMSKAGIRPKLAYRALKLENEKLHANLKAVRNMKYRLKQKEIGGRTAATATLDFLTEEGYSVDHRTSGGKLTHLFFAHQQSIKTANSFPSVFLLDCTYKTNKFNMPLLHIVGLDATYGTFSACFAFLSAEKKNDYVWALEKFRSIFATSIPNVLVTDRDLALMGAIEEVFQQSTNLLCVWHIQKNVLAKCSKIFSKAEHLTNFMQAWSRIIASPDEVTFDSRVEGLSKTFGEKSACVEYVTQTWLGLKEHFVSCWADRIRHFGHLSTSRVEGAHAALKKEIDVSTGDTYSTVKKIDSFVCQQLQDAAARASKNRRIEKHEYEPPVFANVRDIMSEYALNRTFKLYTETELFPKKYAPAISCECSDHVVHGMPCHHVLMQLRKVDGRIQVDHFDDQWRIDDKDFAISAGKADLQSKLDAAIAAFRDRFATAGPFLQKTLIEGLNELGRAPAKSTDNPDVIASRGRPKSKKTPKCSTKRDPSAFELVQKRQSKCSRCHKPGHNIKTCPKRQKRSSDRSASSSEGFTVLSSGSDNVSDESDESEVYASSDVSKKRRKTYKG